jgi:hypothetical protein
MPITINGTGTITGISVGGLPDATITQAELATGVGGTGPAFSAYQSTLQSVATATFTKIQCQTEEFDTNSNYDNATNYRFTPTVGGYYQVSCSVGFASAATLIPLIYKNGTEYKRGPQLSGTANQNGCSILVSLNGSTDYIEFYAFQSSGGALNTSAVATTTYFQASMVRGA